MAGLVDIETVRTAFDIINSSCLAAESVFIGIKIHRLRKVNDARAISMVCELFFTGWSLLSIGFYLSIPRYWSAAACFCATVMLGLFTFTAWRLQRRSLIAQIERVP